MDTSASAALQYQALGLSPAFARLLAARGWREADALVEFLYPRLEHTHSPWLLLGMEAAAARVLQAIASAQPIRILGDYDADGTLATVILRQALASLGATVSYQLPHRLQEGYGLQTAAIERAAADGVGLAITVDTGIREFEPLARARELGLDVIVTDHHLPGDRLPEAFAIVNPHQPGCPYPDKNLCGTGVAFKLAHALLERAGRLAGPNEGAWPARLRSYLKLVAIATIADAVPLLGENRVLARFGLEGLVDPVNPGLRALLAAAQAGAREPRPPTSRDVAFSIAPRLNAAGRMGHADRVVELFFTPAAEVQAAAQALEAANLERQRECERMEREIWARAAADPALLDAPVALLAGAGWHRGVLGIVASRVMARTGRPVVVVALEGELAHGSGRAPDGVHLLERLESCRDLFTRYGGHAQAVGFTLPAARLGEFAAALRSFPAEAAPAPPDDEAFELPLSALTLAFARELARMEPFGEGNREPLFTVRRVRLAQPPQRLKDRHLKLLVVPGDGQGGEPHTALFWNLWRDGVYQSAPRRPAWEALRPGCELDLVFRWERQQLILRDFFVTSAAAAESHTVAGRSL